MDLYPQLKKVNKNIQIQEQAEPLRHTVPKANVSSDLLILHLNALLNF